MLRNARPALIIGLVVVAAIALFAFRGCSGIVPSTGGSDRVPNNQVENPLGDMYIASQVDQTGCPLDRATRFTPGDAVYVGAGPSDVPAGTSVFARLLRDGQPIEDTDEVTADRDLRDTCVWFEFSADRGLEPGNYTAELIVNGSRADQVQFAVDEDARGGGLFSDDNRASGLEDVFLGRLIVTNRVDANGCPSGLTRTFDSRDRIIAALEESEIPAGTEMYARLLYEGDVVEETERIYADRDMQSCVWFAFESNERGGFAPGDYEAQIYVNGSRAERVTFEVRD